jgi:hypothetical protein
MVSEALADASCRIWFFRCNHSDEAAENHEELHPTVASFAGFTVCVEIKMTLNYHSNENDAQTIQCS